MEYTLRHPEIHPVNDHVWLMDDNHEATFYVVAGNKQAMVIDTSIGMCNVREEARKVTQLPLICVNTHGHGDHMGGNWSFDKAYMHPSDLPLAQEAMEWPEVQAAINQMGIRYPGFEPIADGQIFDLGGIALQALCLPGHTPGEIVLLDAKDRLLFSGDGIIEHLWLQLPESLPVQTQIDSMRRLLPLRNQFDHILTGHCSAPVDASLFDALLAAAEELAAGKTENDIDYPWLGNVGRAHPYAENRRIVYK